MAIALDLSGLPVALVRPPSAPISDQEFETFLSEFRRAMLDRGEPYATVVDLRGNPGITPVQRKSLSEYIREGEELGIACVATALVFDSLLLRGLLTAIFWLRQPEYPVQVFRTAEEANLWCMQQMAQPRWRSTGTG